MVMRPWAAERCRAPKTAKGAANHKLSRATTLSRPRACARSVLAAHSATRKSRIPAAHIEFTVRESSKNARRMVCVMSMPRRKVTCSFRGTVPRSIRLQFLSDASCDIWLLSRIGPDLQRRAGLLVRVRSAAPAIVLANPRIHSTPLRDSGLVLEEIGLMFARRPAKWHAISREHPIESCSHCLDLLIVAESLAACVPNAPRRCDWMMLLGCQLKYRALVMTSPKRSCTIKIARFVQQQSIVGIGTVRSVMEAMSDALLPLAARGS